MTNIFDLIGQCYLTKTTGKLPNDDFIILAIYYEDVIPKDANASSNGVVVKSRYIEMKSINGIISYTRGTLESVKFCTVPFGMFQISYKDFMLLWNYQHYKFVNNFRNAVESIASLNT